MQQRLKFLQTYLIYHANLNPCIFLNKKMFTRLLVSIFCLLIIVNSASFFNVDPEQLDLLLPRRADSIYYNGTILTMDLNIKKANFVAVKNKKIIYVGADFQQTILYKGEQTKMINLQGRTMLPGFVEPHAHFGSMAVLLHQPISIKSPPFGPVTCIGDLLYTIKLYISLHSIPQGQAIYFQGYSDIDMKEKRHPNRFELDWISDKHPIFLRHFTQHLFALNSMALKDIGYDEQTQNISGGTIDKYRNGTLTGVLREKAIQPVVIKYTPNILDLEPRQLNEVADQLYSVGITNSQDIIMTPDESAQYKAMGDDLKMDISSYIFLMSSNLSNYYSSKSLFQTDKYRIKGVKLIMDGSIQTYTALMNQPYYVPEKKMRDDLTDYKYDSSRTCEYENCGVDYFFNKKDLRELLLQCHHNEINVFVHCNGDKAADNFLDALDWVRHRAIVKNPTKFTIIHAQTLREDQLDRMAELDVQVSFYSTQIYFWGDYHYDIFLGPERTLFMNPIKSAIQRNITYSLHNDSPVVVTGIYEGMNTFLKSVECAVTRKTKGGRILNPDEIITVQEGLKGVTINSAKIMGIDKEVGSITMSKSADFVIMAKNPLAVEPEELSLIKILTTIKGDKIMYGNYPNHFLFDDGGQVDSQAQ